MRRVSAGLFLISAAIILMQIALTRVFAIMLWHHLTYMVISIALLGFGAAGSILTILRTAEREEPVDGALALLASGFAASVGVSYFVATLTPVDTLEIWRNGWDFLSLGLLYGTVFVPFLLGGATVGLALTRLNQHVDRLYFFDLLGSAFGGVISVWALSSMGSSATVLAAGVLGGVSAVVFSLGASRRSRLVATSALALSSAVWLGLLSGAIDWHVPYAPGKEFAHFNESGDHVTRLYSATAEVEVGSHVPLPPISGGEFSGVTRKLVMGRGVGQDGTAPTMLYENAAGLEDSVPFLRDSSTALGYVAFDARGDRGPKALVIGVGGGVDVMIALAHGASRVTAVEINTAMIEMVTERFDEYLGGLFRPGAHDYSSRISLVRGEGRSHVRSADDKYDIIQMSGVDSFTALSTGAYTLSESYLYTVEAVRDFYEHLEPGGFIVYSRHIMRLPKKPRETMRLANIARQALSESGVLEPGSQILVMRADSWASTLIKRGAFTRKEVDAIARFSRDHGFWGVVYDPLHASGTSHPDIGQPDMGVRADYTTLLRGSDREREEFVAAYPYDLSPSRDDSPFFFNYYRYRQLFDSWGSDDSSLQRGEHYYADYPTGHVILIASLAQITLLAALLILLPLRALGRTHVSTPAHLRVFAYFAALGIGFMFIEISVMQRLVLFLGHPTYAVTVALTTLLASAGIGSLLSGRVVVVTPRVLRLLLGAIVALLLGVLATIAWGLPLVLGSPYVVRVMISVLLLAPLGIALGMPFPLGIRLLSGRAPALIPWAWAINGFLSVFASIFCIVLAMQVGFSVVLLSSGAIYAVGLLSLASFASEPHPVSTRGLGRGPSSRSGLGAEEEIR